MDVHLRRDKQVALALTGVLSAGCASLGSDYVTEEQARRAGERFSEASFASRDQPPLAWRDAILDLLVAKTLPDLSRVQSISLQRAPADQITQGGALTIELDPDNRTGTFRVTVYDVVPTTHLMYPKEPRVVGTYQVAVAPHPKWTSARTLSFDVTSLWFSASIQIAQPLGTPAERRAMVLAGQTPVEVQVGVRPSLLGRILGVPSVVMTKPLPLNLLIGEDSAIAEVRNREMLAHLSEHQGSFADELSYERAVSHLSKPGSWSSSIRWSPHATTASVQLGATAGMETLLILADQSASPAIVRVLGGGDSGLVVLDAVALLEGLHAESLGTLRSWADVAARGRFWLNSQDVVCASIERNGVKRKIEFLGLEDEASSRQAEILQSAWVLGILDGVLSAERDSGVTSGALTIRGVSDQVASGAMRGRAAGTPLGCVELSLDQLRPNIELSGVRVGNQWLSDLFREQGSKLGFLAARREIGRILAMHPAWPPGDSQLSSVESPIGREMASLLAHQAARNLGLPLATSLRGELAFCILEIMRSPELGELVAERSPEFQSEVQKLIATVRNLLPRAALNR